MRPDACADCRKQRQYARQSAWRRANPHRIKEYNSRQSAGRAAAYQRYKSEPGWRAKERAAAHGLSAEAVEQMYIEQGGACRVCLVVVEIDAMRIDHDHVSGRIRKLLCHRCNLMLGMGKDSPELLRRGAAYIEDHRG